MKQVSQPSQRNFPWIAVAVSCVVVLVVLVLSWNVWRYYVTFQGVEFSPYSFHRRNFMCIPQVYTKYETPMLACATEISKHLTNSVTSANVNRWDLAKYGAPYESEARHGEAMSLLQFIDGEFRHYDSEWEDWSKENPDLAANLWPSVQQLAIQHLYFCIPELLHRAKDISKVDKLKELIAEVSLQASLDRLEFLTAQKKSAEARQLLVWAKQAIGARPALIDFEERLGPIAP
jgi:hypothetical protein